MAIINYQKQHHYSVAEPENDRIYAIPLPSVAIFGSATE